MLTLQNKQLNSIFERVLRDKNGVLMRVRFTVVEINGQFQAQIISATPIVNEAKKEVLSLPKVKENQVLAKDITPSFISILSPYLSLEFFMSQPTRAPAF